MKETKISHPNQKKTIETSTLVISQLLFTVSPTALSVYIYEYKRFYRTLKLRSQVQFCCELQRNSVNVKLTSSLSNCSVPPISSSMRLSTELGRLICTSGPLSLSSRMSEESIFIHEFHQKQKAVHDETMTWKCRQQNDKRHCQSEVMFFIFSSLGNSMYLIILISADLLFPIFKIISIGKTIVIPF